MSVDISDKRIGAARQAILSKADPTSWLMLNYDPSSRSPILRLLSSGSDPAVPQIKETLAASDEEVLFGYADIGGKGLVLAYLKDSVGGVRRAKAVVHSRAITTLFPDYSALITIAHPDQLTEDLVVDKLGLHHQPAQRPLALYAVPVATAPVGTAQTSPPVPEKDVPVSASQRNFPAAGSSHSLTSSPSVHSHHSQASRRSQTSRQSSRRGPAIQHSRPHTPQQVNAELQEDLGATPRNPHEQHRAEMTTPSGGPSPLPLAPPLSISSTKPLSSHLSHSSSPLRQSPRIVSAPVHTHDHKPISSADFFPDNRTRKASLSSRLGQLASFGKGSPSSPKSPPLPPPDSPGSPNAQRSPPSPSRSRFMNSHLIKNFGRGPSAKASNSPPTSPGGNSFFRRASQPPPVPPKDIDVEETYGPSTTYSSPIDSVPTRHDSLAPAFPRPPSQNGRHRDVERKISPSPSAQQVLADASQKRIKTESEIQERFRRDLEERERARHIAVNGEEEVMEDPTAQDRLSVRPARLVDSVYDVEHEGLPYDRDAESPVPPARELPAMNGSTGPPETPEIETVGERHVEHQGLQDEVQGDSEVRHQLEEMELAEEGEMGGTEIGLSIEAERYAEEQRLAREAEAAEAKEKAEAEAEAGARAEEEERVRREEEERARAEEERERTRLEQEERQRQLDEQRRREEEERIAREAEERRLREEEEGRRRQVEEEERIRREAEEAQLAKVEAERRKKEQMVSSFAGTKGSGGVMLSGHITVQSTRSTIWRRRWFKLFNDRIDLYKNDGDAKTIQVIPLPGATVSQTYEESQVQGSFKISLGDQSDDFFLFTDGPEDKEMVLAALSVAIGP